MTSVPNPLLRLSGNDFSFVRIRDLIRVNSCLGFMKIKLILLCIVLSGCFVNRPATAQDYVLDKKDTSEVRYINKKKFFIYKVEKGETLYSLTKKFGVTEA